MNLKRIFHRLAATATTMIGVTALAATPAHADYSQCAGTNWICVWSDNNYSGRFVGTAEKSNYWIGDFINDRTSSIWNRTSYGIGFWSDIGCGGYRVYYLGPGDSAPSLPAGVNDQISSWCV